METKQKMAIYLLGGIALLLSGCKLEEMKPPVAEKIKNELTTHGHIRVDNYFWLNERDNPKVVDYLEAENSYKEAMMKHTEPLQKKLYNEIVGRIKRDDETVPYKDNGYYYYTRYEEGAEHPIYCRKKETLDAEEEIMLNINEMAKDFAYYNIGNFSVSPDNKTLAYSVDTLSRRIYTIYFKNLITGDILEEKIPDISGYGFAWANDNKTLFYTGKDLQTLRGDKICKHALGTNPANDKEVYNETDETFRLSVSNSKSKKYIIIAASSTLSDEYQYLDASTPNKEFKVIQPRERDLKYSVSHYRDHFYIRTNLGDATNFKLVKTAVNMTTKENWEEFIPHREDVLIESIELFEKYLVIKERKNGLIQLRVIKWDTNEGYYLEFDEETYYATISTNADFDTDLFRFSYTSLTTPNSIFDFNMSTKEKTLLKEEEVLGDFDKNNYRTERLYATAKDGKKVPISLVYRKGLQKNGDAPVLLYAYGSYGYSTDAVFNSSNLSLLDRGFVYAIAHIRGGQDLGRQWYEDGKLLKKKNTFTDFNACAEYLIKEQYTNSDKLFAAGGSAGGLLMGVIANTRPDLYKGIIAAVPFVDVVTTMLDESIPLTTFEYDEWGNPNNKEYYDYMLSYSPYDNVEAKAYPSMLVTAGYHDSQVQYWEPAKWVAKLREMKTDNNLLLLHTNMDYGHGGASGRFEIYKERALEYAFMLDLVGIKK